MRASKETPRKLLLSALCLTSLFAWARAAEAEARWRQLPFFGGPVRSVAAAPSDPRVVYAVAYGGGVFRSDDGGITWAPPSAAASMRGQGVVTVSPADPREVLFSAVQFFLPHFARSRDGGATWERITVGSSDEVGGVIGLVYDPTNSARLYARTFNGLFLSTNDGRTWRRIAFAGSSIGRLYVDPHAPMRLLVLVDLPQGSTLLESGDGGATWIERISSNTAGNPMFAVDRVHPTTLYFTIGAGLLVSEDDGATWREAAGSGDLVGLTNLATTPSGALLAASFYGIQRSVDQGATFGRTRTGDSIGQIALAPDGTLYAAGNFGIWRSTADGATWSRSVRGITGQYVLGLAASGGPRPALLAAGAGLFRGTAGGTLWSPVPKASGIGTFNPYFPPYVLAFSPRDPRLAFAVLDGGVFRSSDGGISWHQIRPLHNYPLGDLGPWRFAFAFDSNDPQTVYFFAGFAGLSFSFYSTDGGETWLHRFRAPELASVAIDPHRTSTLIGVTVTGLLKSDDRGVHWRPIAPEVGKPTVVAFDPRGVLYAGTENSGVWASRDGGTTFRPLGRGLHGERIAMLLADPAHPGRLFASVARRGVFLWDARATAWRKLALDFPAAAFMDGLIALDPSGEGALYAATWGRGVYRLDLGVE